MSRSCDSSTRQYSDTAPTHIRCAVPAHEPVSSDCGNCRRPELSPATTAAWATARERRAQFESVGKSLPSFRFYQFQYFSNELADFDQAIRVLPARAHMNKRTADLFGRDFSVGARYYSRRFALGCFQQLGVSDDVGHTETRQPRLAGAKEFARAAQLEVEFGDLETVVGAYHSIE